MLKEPELPSLDESGDLLAEQLQAKSISVESAMVHVFSPEFAVMHDTQLIVVSRYRIL